MSARLSSDEVITDHDGRWLVLGFPVDGWHIGEHMFCEKRYVVVAVLSFAQDRDVR
jgi:hypothetical protein